MCLSEGSILIDPYQGRYTSPGKKWVPYFAPFLGGLILGHTEEIRDGIRPLSDTKNLENRFVVRV
jgi:hypothetical protein